MIAQLRGKLVEKKPTGIVVECGGVGYDINISLNSYAQLPKEENIRIYTFLQVREDALTLFGFMTKKERVVFKKLITVSGIGTSTAQTMLSSMTPDQVIEAITTENVAELKSVKGIGAKTAQRVIVDLKDKFGDLEVTERSLSATSAANTQKEEALSALETLGYKRKQSVKVVRKILMDTPEANAETIIKLALKRL